MKSAGLAVLFLLLPALALASPRFDPRLEWRILETDHFLVHYHTELEQLAPRAARIAEEVHEELTAALGWTPASRTHMVLADVTDSPNAFATPFPYNRMILHLTPPLEQPFSLTDREEWLRIVIAHEYTHILHLDTVRRVPAGLRRIFGRVYFPNAVQPLWIIEGLAVHEESRLTGGGRVAASYTDMVLRMAVLENRFPTPGQAAVFLDSWPAGETPYLFGGRFLAHLTEKYGEDLPRRLNHSYAGKPIPYLVDSSARETIGRSFGDEWNRWRRELAVHYRKEQRRLQEEGLTPFTRLTDEGYRHLMPAVSPSGELVAFSAQTADRTPHLMLMKSDGTARRTILRRLVTPAGAGIAWLPGDAGLIYAKLERDRFDNIFHDLFRLDLKTGKEERLTRGLRAASPDLSPDGARLVFTVAGEGHSRLALSDTDGTHLRMIHPPEDPRDFFSPRWSPEGRRIAVATKEPGGAFALLVLDPEGREQVRITMGDAVLGGPAWSPDGATLYFSADARGIYNLYACRLLDGSLHQVTSVLGGAFSPSVSPDGSTLYFTSYSAAGFDLARLPIEPERWKNAGRISQTPPTEPEPVLAEASPSRSYSPGMTLLPRYWLPALGWDEDGVQLGLLTSGNDPLERHSYLASALYGLESRRGAYSLFYQYDGFYPTVQLFAADRALFYDDFFRPPGLSARNFWERRRTVGLDVVVPFAGLWSRHFLVPGYRWESFRGLTDPPFGEPRPEEGELSSFRLAYRFADTVRPPKAISPAEGRWLEIAAQHSDSAFGSDFSQSRFTLDWREFLDLPWRHHVLASRLFGGYATGDVLAQRAFRVGGDTPGDFLQGVDGEYLPLRGYSTNTFRGQRAVLASLEYRFPVVNLEEGPGNGAFFFRRVHGAVFAEGAQAFDSGGIRTRDVRTSAGVEARFDMDIGYFLPVTWRLVFAHGFDEGGETQGYLSLWLRL